MIDHRSYTKLRAAFSPSWLDSSVGRALHRYRRGRGFESRSGLNVFQALILQVLKLCITAMINHVFKFFTVSHLRPCAKKATRKILPIYSGVISFL